jgi:hypothetical protein
LLYCGNCANAIAVYIVINILKMKTLKVVNLKSEFKSFSWNDGLFAIQKQVGDIVYLWKIKDGKLDRYEDDTPNITLTGINNTGITPTDLVVFVE